VPHVVALRIGGLPEKGYARDGWNNLLENLRRLAPTSGPRTLLPVIFPPGRARRVRPENLKCLRDPPKPGPSRRLGFFFWPHATGFRCPSYQGMS
jgi:hypothetical protein